jgi:hypothetical protein
MASSPKPGTREGIDRGTACEALIGVDFRKGSATGAEGNLPARIPGGLESAHFDEFQLDQADSGDLHAHGPDRHRGGDTEEAASFPFLDFKENTLVGYSVRGPRPSTCTGTPENHTFKY